MIHMHCNSTGVSDIRDFTIVVSYNGLKLDTENELGAAAKS